MFRQFIARGEEAPLDFADIRAICRNDVNIVEFNDLNEYSTYEELFRKNRRIVLFWATQAENIGHYNVLLYKVDDKAYGSREYVEVFDSYGKSIDDVFRLANYDYSLFRGVNPLWRLLKGIEVIQNKEQFQSSNLQIATCGRYAGLRCRFYMMSNAKFNTFLRSGTVPPDQLVTAMTVMFSNVNPLLTQR
jgi:hypothetical protein